MENRTNEATFSIQTLEPGNPGSGADLSFTVPDKMRIQILAFEFQFATSGVAANRFLNVHGNDGTQDVIFNQAPTAQTASETLFYHFIMGQTFLHDATDGTNVIVNLSSGMFFEAGETVNTTIVNLSELDAITAISLRCKVWITE